MGKHVLRSIPADLYEGGARPFSDTSFIVPARRCRASSKIDGPFADFLCVGGENDKHGWKGIFARLLYEENFQVRKNDGILS